MYVCRKWRDVLFECCTNNLGVLHPIEGWQWFSCGELGKKDNHRPRDSSLQKQWLIFFHRSKRFVNSRFVALRSVPKWMWLLKLLEMDDYWHGMIIWTIHQWSVFALPHSSSFLPCLEIFFVCLLVDWLNLISDQTFESGNKNQASITTLLVFIHRFRSLIDIQANLIVFEALILKKSDYNVVKWAMICEKISFNTETIRNLSFSV